MSIWSDFFKRMMDSFQHENAAEYLTASQKADYLNRMQGVSVTVTAPISEDVVPTTSKAGRRIALYMGAELPSQMMDYVLETCTNLKHALTVITFESENTARALLNPYKKVLDDAGIEMKLVTLSGDPINRLARYLKTHPEIAFLACKDTGYLAHKYMDGSKTKNTLPVPVVVVVTKQEAAMLDAAENNNTVESNQIA